MRAGTKGDIDAAFAALVQERVDALLVANDPFFVSRRHAIPVIYSACEYGRQAA
jgi:hypothetical protein